MIYAYPNTQFFSGRYLYTFHAVRIYNLSYEWMYDKLHLRYHLQLNKSNFEITR